MHIGDNKGKHDVKNDTIQVMGDLMSGKDNEASKVSMISM